MSQPRPKMIDLEKDRDDMSSQRQDHDSQKSQGASLQQEHDDKKSQGEVVAQPEKDEKALKDKSMKPTDNDAAMPTGLTFALIMASIFSAFFLTSLDKLIISTAIPQITDTFNSQDDIGWYGTAYLITNCSFQIVFGKLYKFLPVKLLFLGSLLLFMVGSALCGAAPNSIALILGRAIAGLGAGGVVTGIFVILVFTVPLQKRPIYQGYFGVMFGISSILGPTIGGAFATHVTWRWCFYINLPIGGLVGAIIVFFLHLPTKSGPKMPLKDKLWQMNPLGTLFIVSGTVLLCLALQWGGITYAWSNGRVIAVLVLALLLLIAFALVQFWLPEQAILPPHIFVQRSIVAGFWTSICLGAHQTIFLYYIPTWLQAVKGKSAVESGVDLLTMVLPFSALSLLTGHLISRFGYYTPFLILGVCITAVGTGLLTTLQVNSSTGAWVGYQVLYGVGLGFAGQIPSMAAYTVLSKENVGIGASLMFFGQTLFGAIFVSVGQNVLDQQLIKRLSGTPGVDAATISRTGVTNILDNVPLKYQASALQAYNNSLRAVFQVALCVACIGIPGAFAMEWRSVKKGSSKDPHGEKGIAREQGSAENAHNEEAAGVEGQDYRTTTSSAIIDEAKATDGDVPVTKSMAGSVATQTTAVEGTKTQTS